MKALVINDARSHYGFVIDVEQNRDGSYYDSVADLVYEARELQFQENNKSVDWSAFRREAAKDAMTGMMANADFWHQVWSNNRINGRCDYPSKIAHFAIACADELIKQLKQQ